MPITHELLRWLLTFAVMFLGVRTEAGAPPSVAIETTPAAVTALTAALRYAPADLRLLQFTDWNLLRQYAGIEDAPDDAASLRRLMPRDSEFYVPNGYAAQTAAGNASLWGWDFNDLHWESALQLGDGRTAYVMRLRDDYPLDELLARFEERGYTRTEAAGAILLSRAMDLSQPWSVDIAVFNAAILPEEHILIHAPAAENVYQVVAARSGALSAAADAPAYADIAAQLGAVAGALLGPYAIHCAIFDPAILLAASDQAITAEAVRAAVVERFGDRPLSPFLALGVGYALANEQPIGRIALAYPDAASAQSDLAPRTALATTGKSLLVDEFVSAVTYTVDDAAAVDRTIVFTVTPVNHQPGRLFTMFYARDMGFAGCPAQ